MISFAGNKM